MGSSIATVQKASNSYGKGSPQPQQTQQTFQPPVIDGASLNTSPQGKGASGQKFTYSPTSGQPTVGVPNQYTNTVGQWDNANIQPSFQPRSGGKGKG